jgi:hypothetical protein
MRRIPLLLSVRSGAADSMPGMMNTILNLGLTDATVESLAEGTGNRRFAYDAYRRLINMFGDVVMGIDHEHYEHAFDAIKRKYGAALDTDVPVEGLVELCQAYEDVYQQHTGKPFPQDPLTQLELSIEAVFRSWMAPRAIRYREVENIRGLLGTAVNVQSMVYGNMGLDSGTGVAFTRNPSTGENKFYGEFLVNAQGEDVVAGIRTPLPVAQMPEWKTPELPDAWARTCHKQLLQIKKILEEHYRRCRTSSSPSSGARCSCCRPARQAHRSRLGEDRLRPGQREADRREDRAAADSRQRSDAVAAAQFQPRRQEESRSAGHRVARIAGRRRRQAGVHRRGSRSADQGRRDGACWSAKRPAPRTSTACTALPGS